MGHQPVELGRAEARHLLEVLDHLCCRLTGFMDCLPGTMHSRDKNPLVRIHQPRDVNVEDSGLCEFLHRLKKRSQLM